jgi:hypothetical protein
MGLLEDLGFETERRGIVFHKGTSMPDASQLGYDGDPNLANPLVSDGEFLLHNCPSGTRYIQKNVSPHVFWKKAADSPGGIWLQEASGGSVAVLQIRNFKVSARYATNEIINITTGLGAGTGTSVITGNSIASIGATGPEFIANNDTQIRLNGAYMAKGTTVIWDSSLSFHFAVSLDVEDYFEVVTTV